MTWLRRKLDQMQFWLYGPMVQRTPATVVPATLPPEVRDAFHKVHNELAVLKALTVQMHKRDVEDHVE